MYILVDSQGNRQQYISNGGQGHIYMLWGMIPMSKVCPAVPQVLTKVGYM